ncbi:MAG: dTDP-4-dehydrorhamnose 3,5-epimerase [uncultured Acetobacteraceae bacterium]|uniref:dTDP-4-dehydrorhamnose 3,5-epimerase n=1 Tax=uncultured Acetobacteraceae bacterium TaxID=169975 RepID=A0A6J4JI15_9PROT|nr:MAG: dTDP-4-dehydrorhamnose 3,5-epimerase [uncultured Acetobacteraceae bacterium]
MSAALDLPPRAKPSRSAAALQLLGHSGNLTAWGFAAVAGPLLLNTRQFTDPRGVFAETYSRRAAAALGLEDEFVQDNWSCSDRVGTVRGLHFQRRPHAQAKLVRVLRGRILDVAVDLRRCSPTFGQHVAVELAAGDGRMLYVPVDFAHGFCTLEPMTEVAYKVSADYAPEADAGIAWNDPALGIDWPVSADAACVSLKDALLPRLCELPTGFA